MRQAVDQIDRNRLETIGSGGSNDVSRFLFALDTINRNLHAFVKILNTNAHPVETEFAKQCNGCSVDLARVDLDRILAALKQLEMLARLAHQLTHFVMRQEGWRATTPMQLNHFVLTITAFKTGALQRQLFSEIFQVLGATSVILGNDLIAGAVVANRVTKGNVEI